MARQAGDAAAAAAQRVGELEAQAVELWAAQWVGAEAERMRVESGSMREALIQKRADEAEARVEGAVAEHAAVQRELGEVQGRLREATAEVERLAYNPACPLAPRAPHVLCPILVVARRPLAAPTGAGARWPPWARVVAPPCGLGSTRL